MSDSELVIAGFYDHEIDSVRRPADWGGDDLFAAPASRSRRFERRQHAEPAPQAPPAPQAAPAPLDAYVEPVAVSPARRTVTITGRPDAYPAPRRPSRTIDERIAHRPERIASWTCALGALSILLAIVTAQ